MEIQSKVIKNTDNSSPVKAYATIVLNNNIAIHGFRIIDIGTDDNDAMFVAMPSNRNSDGKYYDMTMRTNIQYNAGKKCLMRFTVTTDFCHCIANP